MQTFQPNVFTPTILIGIIDFYHFIPFSVTLTLAAVVTRSVESKTCGLHLLARFSIDQDEIWYGVGAV